MKGTQASSANSLPQSAPQGKAFPRRLLPAPYRMSGTRGSGGRCRCWGIWSQQGQIQIEIWWIPRPRPPRQGAVAEHSCCCCTRGCLASAPTFLTAATTTAV